MTADDSLPREAEDGRLVKHSLVVAGHRTSVSLEGIFWRALRAIAEDRGLSVAVLVREIDATRGAANLSSALRVFVMREQSGARSRALAAHAEESRT